MKILVFLFNIYKNKRLLLISIFLLSLFASLIFLLLFKDIGPSQHRIPGTDYLTLYNPIANSILEGSGIVKEGKLVTEVPPGYPIILSIIFSLSYFLGIDELQLIVIFNVIITAAASFVLFLIGELLFNKKIGLIASFLWMSYPFNLWFIKNPHTELPFILLLYLGIYLYILSLRKKSWKHIFLAGIIFGFTSLIRPTSLLLSFLLALLIIFFPKNFPKKVRCLLAVVLLIGNLLVIFPWEIYIFSQTGKFIPISTLGPAAFNIGFTSFLRPGGAGDRIIVSSDVQALIERAAAENFNSGSAIFYFCLKELTTRPVPFLKLLGLKALRAWYATSSKWYENLILAVQIPYLLTVFLGVILGIKIYQKKIKNIILLLAIIIYFWIITIYAHSILRYMIPAMGLVLIFSAITLNILIEKLVKRIKLLSHANFSFNNNSLPE